MPIPEFLYRGVSKEIHEANHGVLKPKCPGGEFIYTFKVGEKGLKCGCGAILGGTEANAIIRHQLNQEGFPTSGVSTTPFLKPAKDYALHGGADGIIYRISTDILRRCGVRVLRVADTARLPSVPEDDEFIIVAADGGSISADAVVELIPVSSAAGDCNGQPLT
jgi:hypothetical protein